MDVDGLFGRLFRAIERPYMRPAPAALSRWQREEFVRVLVEAGEKDASDSTLTEDEMWRAMAIREIEEELRGGRNVYEDR